MPLLRGIFVNFLLSLAHLREKEDIEKLPDGILWDSGAFTYFRTNEVVQIGKFVQQIQRFHKFNKKFEFISLDNIASFEITEYNHKKIKEKLPPDFPIFPVYKHTQSIEKLKQMLDENKYITIAGLANFTKVRTDFFKNRNEFIQRVEEAITRVNKKRIHLLGYSSFNLKYQHLNNKVSTDSSSFHCIQFGIVVIFENQYPHRISLSSNRKEKLKQVFALCEQNAFLSMLSKRFQEKKMSFVDFITNLNYYASIVYKNLLKEKNNIEYLFSLSSGYKAEILKFQKIKEFLNASF